MTNTPRVRSGLHASRAAASVLAVAIAMTAAIAFTARTGYPWSPGSPPAIAIAAAIWIGAAIIISAASVAAQRRAGVQWDRAIAADALTYIPLTLLWFAFLRGRYSPAPPPLFAAVVAATLTAKAALVTAASRDRLVALGEGDLARRIGGVASWLSAIARVLAPFAVVALAARWQVLHLWDGLATPEEGLLAHAAQAILSGEILYRDLRSVFAPGTPYLHAGLFAAFGKTLVVGKIALIVGPVLTSLALYYVAHRIMPAAIAFLAAALFALSGEGNVATFFALAAIGMSFAVSGDRRANWATAGILAGVAVSFDVAIGTAAAAALAVMLCLRQRGWIMRRVGTTDVDLSLGMWALGPFALGLIVVCAPVPLYFASRGALAPMWGDLMSGLRGQVFHLLRPPASPSALTASLVVYGIVVALLISRLTLRWLAEADFLALTVIVFGGIGAAWAWRTQDAYHLAVSGAALYVVAGWLVARSLWALAQAVVGWPLSDAVRTTRAAAAALVVVGGAWTASGWVRPAVANADAIIRARALIVPPEGWTPTGLTVDGGAYLSAREGSAVVRLVDYIQRHTRADEPIFCVPAGAAIYVLAERPHATRLDCGAAGEVPAEDAAEAVVRLDSEAVRLVVVAPREAPAAARESTEPLIRRYLGKRYRAAVRFGDYTVLIRKGAAPARAAPGNKGEKPTPGPPPGMFGPAPKWKR